MAESKIFKYANDITYNRSVNSARSVTTGGYARTHRLGPTIYNIKANLPLLTEEQYREVENELFEIDDGIEFLNVNISSNNGNNIMSQGTIPLKSGETHIKVIKQDYSKLNQFTLVNLAPSTNDIFKVGDFLQFDNSSKVYQVFKPIGESGSTFSSSAGGTVRVRLSSPIVSNIGVSSNSSYGSREQFYFVNGTGDENEVVTYTFSAGSGSNTNQVNGLITFVDTSGNPYQYADGTTAVCHIPYYEHSIADYMRVINNSINGTATYSDLTTAEQDQNHKLNQILDIVSSGTVFTFNFNVPNVRMVLTTPTKPTGQSFTNETVVSTLTNPYQEGLISFKDSNGNNLVDSNGNNISIVLPKSLHTAQEIYNYIYNDIMGSNSTHPVKTLGVLDLVQSGAFPEFYNEPVLDHVGRFEIRWGIEYVGSIMEYTTPTGTIPTNFNDILPTGDTINSITTSPIGITIENASRTYSVGEYLQPSEFLLSSSTSYSHKILNVNVSGTTTTIEFDTTFATSMSGWDLGDSLNKHDNDSLSTTTGLLRKNREVTPAQYYTSSANVLMGDDINMKLMLTQKPQVTIVPKDEEKNLYKYDSFEFTEVL